MSQADSLIVLDFETTGLSPNSGDRAIEVGAVRIHEGQITHSFQALMNPGFKISGFIEHYTGITNAMLAKAPPCGEVMSQFATFIGDSNLVAHNASFDQKFLAAEMTRIQQYHVGGFSCSLLAARRVFPSAPNYTLSTLVNYMNLETNGVFHRALYDAEMAARVWLSIVNKLKQQYELPCIPFELMLKLNKTAKKAVPKFLTAMSRAR